MTISITTHEELLKLHGKSIKCFIYDTEITDAKICVEGDEIYVCQNKRNGDSCENKLGYEYSWCISSQGNKYEEYNGCTKIELVDDVEIPAPVPTEYKCLVDATKEQKKQIAEFESVLDNIKIEAMKLNARDFKKLIKVLQEI